MAGTDFVFLFFKGMGHNRILFLLLGAMQYILVVVFLQYMVRVTNGAVKIKVRLACMEKFLERSPNVIDGTILEICIQ